MLRAVNSTSITLIPKGEHANSIKDYRPIACCTVLHKIISKVLTHRLIVLWRSISRNIILSHKLVKGYARKNISPRCMIKVDLQKAHDSIEWCAVEQILKGLGDPC